MEQDDLMSKLYLWIPISETKHLNFGEAKYYLNPSTEILILFFVSKRL